MVDPATIPDHDGIKEILSAPDGPPVMVLDLGGSEDLDGDGLVSVYLKPDGELGFEDA